LEGLRNLLMSIPQTIRQSAKEGSEFEKKHPVASAAVPGLSGAAGVYQAMIEKPGLATMQHMEEQAKAHGTKVPVAAKLLASLPMVGPLASSLGEKAVGDPQAGVKPDVAGALGEGAVYAVAPELIEKAPAALKSLTGKKVMRSLTRTGVSQTREFAADVTAKNAAEIAKAEAKDTAAMEKHRAAQDEVKTANADREAKIQKRASLSTDIQKQSKEIQEGIRKEVAKDGPSRARGNEKYEAVRAKIGDATDPASYVAGAVKEAESDILSGSPENIKQFKELLKREGEAEGQPLTYRSGGNEITVTAEEPFYETLREVSIADGLLQPERPLTFRDYQGFKTEIDRKIASMKGSSSFQGDVNRALEHVRNAIVDRMELMAKNAGALDELKDANGYWSRMTKTFYNPKSPVAKAMKEYDPGHAGKPFFNESDFTPGIEALQEFNPELAEKARNLRRTKAHFDELKNISKEKTAPLPPTPTKRNLQWITPESLQESKVEKVGKAAESTRHAGYYGTIFAAWRGIRGAVGGDLGAVADAFLDAGGMIGATHVAADILERPKVAEWIARPTLADMRALTKLPPEQMQFVSGELQKLAAEAEKQGKPVNPALKLLIIGQAAAQAQPAPQNAP
jgi:hypothetical protein